MEKIGLGHGHANAVVAIWLMPGNGGPAMAADKSPVKSPVKKAAKAPAPKAAANKAAAKKAPAKKK